MATNVGIAAVVASMMWLVGVGPFLLVHLPIVVLAASIGVWLFYIQHQFEHTVWVGNGKWNLQEAALHGSSHYALPSPLRWFTANIGIHHIHHLCSRIPFYRLPLVLRDHPDLDGIGRLTLLQSLGCVRLVLWDEDRQRLVSFREPRPKAKRGPEREAHLISMVESWLHLAVQADRIQAVMDHSRPVIPRNLNLDNS
jgi:omega-6 fatty acid desaturase (delta-12 desaturase)